MSELAHSNHDLNKSSGERARARATERVRAAASDLYLPAHLIVRLALDDKAWHDGVSWRVSVERRLWPLWRQPAGQQGALPPGTSVRFKIPSWPEKHPATDHASTSDRVVRGWVAGEDVDGLLIVDAAGTVWTGLYEVEVSVDDSTGEEAVEKLAQREVSDS
ncbi:MAG TPA: hypothetical protein VGO91_11485 [Pyrinomonadaceae bacterium]|jgi:hypothetical protein|nr:hypothetical protein [Pyrinomonadaceae bacterium]